MKDRLLINQGRDGLYRISWWIAEDGDLGGTLGDGDKRYTAEDLCKADANSRSHLIACITAAKSDGVKRDSNGSYWETRRQAATALKLINLAIKTDGGAPWPEWALKAKAEGWTSPKGWKPS